MQARIPLLLAAAVAVACTHERTQSAPAASTAAPAPSAPATPSSDITVRLVPPHPGEVLPAPAASSAPVASSAPPPAPVPPPIVEPVLVGPDGKTLPETKDKPSTTTPLFKHHVELLFQAIVKDDPSIAMPFFFPVQAYQVVKDIDKPERDWKHRLVHNFERDIHRYHRQLGDSPDKLELVGLDVPEDRSRWMKPGSEGNRIGYYRVLGSDLRYKDASGKDHALRITSLISWRGVWYVVHVHSFK